MKVSPITLNTQSQTSKVKHNNSFNQQFYTKPMSLQHDVVSFKSDDLDDYDDDEIADDDFGYYFSGLPEDITDKVKKRYAKHTLNDEHWEQRARVDYNDHAYKYMNFCKYLFTKAPERETQQFINDVKEHRIKYMNARIKRKQDEINRLEKEKTDNQILIGGKLYLNKKFFDLVKNKVQKIPTAIMIYDGEEANRNKLIDWMKEQTTKDPQFNVVVFNHEENSKTLYRIETETKYAEQRYQQYPQRTILFINDFDKMLMSDNAGLKRILGENSNKKKPITIVFQTQDKSQLASPYTGNAIRIPVKLQLDESIIPEDYLLKDRYTPYYDGYKYKVSKNEEVELFLGSFGRDDTTLWINSSSKDIIKKVVDNIRLIKQEDKFNNINKIQCYGLNEYDDNFGFQPINKYTKDYDRIFEKDL